MCVVGADVDAAAQERAGRDDDGARAEAPALERLDAGNRRSSVVEEQARDGALNRSQRRRAASSSDAHRAPIQAAVALRARRPDRRPLAAVEHPELDAWRGRSRAP